TIVENEVRIRVAAASSTTARRRAQRMDAVTGSSEPSRTDPGRGRIGPLAYSIPLGLWMAAPRPDDGPQDDHGVARPGDRYRGARRHDQGRLPLLEEGRAPEAGPRPGPGPLVDGGGHEPHRAEVGGPAAGGGPGGVRPAPDRLPGPRRPP